jgi:hypothetical protein
MLLYITNLIYNNTQLPINNNANADQKVASFLQKFNTNDYSILQQSRLCRYANQ